MKFRNDIYYYWHNWLSKPIKIKLTLRSALLALLAVFDLLVVLLFGLIAKVTVSGVEGQNSNVEIFGYKILLLHNLGLQQKIAIMGITVTTLVLLKAIFQIYIIKNLNQVMQYWAISKSDMVLSNYLHSKGEIWKGISREKAVYFLSEGYIKIGLDFIIPFVLITSDCFQIFAFSVMLITINVKLTLIAIIPLIAAMWFLVKLNSKKMQEAGRNLIETSSYLNSKVHFALANKRLLIVRNFTEQFSTGLKSTRYSYGLNLEKLTIVPVITKTIFENLIIVFSIAIAAGSYYYYDAVQGTSLLAMYLVAFTRLAPIFLRIQQNLLHIKTSESIRREISEVDSIEESIEVSAHFPFWLHQNGESAILVDEISYGYDDAKYIFKNFNLKISEGKKVVIVGKSGAGKSTLLDIIIGLRIPSKGQIRIKGLTPKNFFAKFPRTLSIVEQEAVFISGTIRENLLICTNEFFEDAHLIEMLAKVGLSDQLLNLDLKISDFENEGHRLSGGEKQKLSLARSLISNPDILLIDEIESGLDPISRNEIRKIVLNLRNTTVIYITHNLEQLDSFDEIIRI